MRILLLLFISSISWGKEQLQDPTQPPASFLEGESAWSETGHRWNVNSILVSPRRKVAIINNKLVQPGELIEGQQVVDIRLEGVVLQGSGGKQIVLLPGKPIKQKSQ